MAEHRIQYIKQNDVQNRVKANIRQYTKKGAKVAIASTRNTETDSVMGKYKVQKHLK